MIFKCSGEVGRDEPLCAALRGVLRAVVESPRGTGGIGSVECRAVVTLYSLLRDHPVDQWGRCQSCRRPGSVLGLRWSSVPGAQQGDVVLASAR
ncbi:MAG: hypothetical protein ABI264_00005 [Pseudonocardiaceae bacterium]